MLNSHIVRSQYPAGEISSEGRWKMIELTAEQVVEFWHRSYTSVDGLWFMKVEEKYGFEVALEVDNEVWKVLPKIQARMVKSMGETAQGTEGLLECLSTKLGLEGFTFEAERAAGGDGFKIVISRCPWHEVMVKSGREELSERVGTLICNTEYSVWASEFGDDIRFTLKDQICKKAESCVLQFGSTLAATP